MLFSSVFVELHPRPNFAFPTFPRALSSLRLDLRTFQRSESVPPILRTLFQVPYPISPLLATLAKTPGVWGYSSHFGTCRRADISTCTRFPIPFPFTLLRTLLHSCKTQPFC